MLMLLVHGPYFESQVSGDNTEELASTGLGDARMWKRAGIPGRFLSFRHEQLRGCGAYNQVLEADAEWV